MLIPVCYFYALLIAKCCLSYQRVFPAAEEMFRSWQCKWVCSQKTFSSLQEIQQKGCVRCIKGTVIERYIGQILSQAGHGIGQADSSLTDLAGGPSYVGCFQCNENHPFTRLRKKKSTKSVVIAMLMFLFSCEKMTGTLEPIHLKISW